MQVLTLTAPSSWASFLINGDASGLSDHEASQADNWLMDNKLPYPSGCEDAGFIYCHDAFSHCGVGADCQRYTFLIP